MNGDLEVDVMNAMRFDAVCLGNHEFDNGFDELARRIRNLDAPVLCANYDFKDTPLKEVVKPYAIVHKSGRKIGIIGLLTDMSQVAGKGIASEILYLHPAGTAEKYAGLLKKEGCELIIALTHLGYEGDFYTDVELAGATRNIDIIVGGHSHTFLDEMKKVKNQDGKDVVIVTAGKWGLGIGQLIVR
jgi:5'-nucleotidase